jgi:hypothetical protein
MEINREQALQLSCDIDAILVVVKGRPSPPECGCIRFRFVGGG